MQKSILFIAMLGIGALMHAQEQSTVVPEWAKIKEQAKFDPNQPGKRRLFATSPYPIETQSIQTTESQVAKQTYNPLRQRLYGTVLPYIKQRYYDIPSFERTPREEVVEWYRFDPRRLWYRELTRSEWQEKLLKYDLKKIKEEIDFLSKKLTLISVAHNWNLKMVNEMGLEFKKLKLKEQRSAIEENKLNTLDKEIDELRMHIQKLKKKKVKLKEKIEKLREELRLKKLEFEY